MATVVSEWGDGMGLWLVLPGPEGSRTMRTSEAPETAASSGFFRRSCSLFFENDGQPHKYTPAHRWDHRLLRRIDVRVRPREILSVEADFPFSIFPLRPVVIGPRFWESRTVSSSNETATENPLVTCRSAPVAG
jgi:hypothetical protein